MTPKQKKLVENYIRLQVKKKLNEEGLPSEEINLQRRTGAKALIKICQRYIEIGGWDSFILQLEKGIRQLKRIK